ncbi:dual specificity protein phosphatase family protein [Candidatus Dojkabacteria bacterium]|jgi:hypothetical protein|nr:dual specificity protein phosphatase family protein [Candidatus Dojkabacteria bacterium]
MNNLSWFKNKLIIGAFPYKVNTEFDGNGIDIVINVSDEWYPEVENQLQETFIKTYWFPMNEHKHSIGLNSIYGALCILKRAEERNLTVYLHCHAGMNRSQIVRCCYYYMISGEQLNHFYCSYINPLISACERNYLPSRTYIEKFLRKLNKQIDKFSGTYSGILDNCKLINEQE